MTLSKQAARRGYFLLKQINRAISQYAMIREGDRVAVAVSGGKDSLSLLTLLRLRQQRAREPYDLCAIHVQGDARGPHDTPPHPPLADWLQAQGHRFASAPLDLPPGESLPLSCHRCTWNRRKTLFQLAEQLDCNVVALAHHADDMAQTALLNLFYGGRLETMFPTTIYFERFRLIRPLLLTPEQNVRRFARACDFPPPPADCPRSETSRRVLVAHVLDLFRRESQNVRANVIRAALRQMGLFEGF